MPLVARIDVRDAMIRVLACLVFGLAPALQADVIITRLANEGVIVEDGIATRIMIDGMVVEPYSVYGGLPPDLVPLFENAAGPFSGIDLALASHQHHDHNQPVHACRFLQSSTGTTFASSAQVMDLMREKCRSFTVSSPRIRIIEPRYERPEVLNVGAATVTTFVLSHGVGKYAALQNFGHVIEMGGMRVLHIGDAAMDATDFARAAVDQMNIDIALIPFWFFQPGPGAGIIRRFLDTPHKIAVHIPPKELDEVRHLLRTEYPTVILLENVLDQARFSATVSPIP